MEIDEVVIYGCYCSPNADVEHFREYLDDIEMDVKKHKKEMIIAGDFNAKAANWSENRNDLIGTELADWIASNALIVQNRGRDSTFERGDQTSIIDVTMTTENVKEKITQWRVSQEETLSDHKYIYSMVET